LLLLSASACKNPEGQKNFETEPSVSMYETIENVLETKVEQADVVAPVILAPTEKRIAFGESIRYKEGVTVSDDSGEAIELHIDSEGVDPNHPGEYMVLYWAEDSAGNRSEVSCKVIIEKPREASEEEVRELAEEILHTLESEELPVEEQLQGIYRFCHDQIRYVGDAERTTELQAAYEGMYYRVGDCYTIFATAKYLMDYLGIENFSVSRKSDTAMHFWSLIHLEQGWYHMDCTPQTGGFECFLRTDSEVEEYGALVRKNPDYYTSDEPDAPSRATKSLH